MTLLIIAGGLLVAVVVVGGLLFRRSWGNFPGESAVLRVQPPTGTSELDTEVQQLLQQGQKIQAIKLVRERSNVGLKEAKAYVDGLERGEAPPPPSARPVTLDDVPPGLVEEAGTLLARGQKIEAIKLVREHTGMGLKAAKDWVDRLEAKLQ
jgi:ribosomal protein L7/L12